MNITQVVWIRRAGGWDAVLDRKVVGHVEDGGNFKAWAWAAKTAHGHSTRRERAFQAVEHDIDMAG